MKKNRIMVIGAGLAGSNASFYLAEKGHEVILVENKMLEKNPAQKLSTFAELVCTNSLKSKDKNSAHGLLKNEMAAIGSLVIDSANETSVPAGDALAVDREAFSELITKRLTEHENITLVKREASNPLDLAGEFECSDVIMATGPLTTDKLSTWIQKEISGEDFYFYDAIAPVVDSDSLDYSKMYFKDRHKEASDTADYLNAPMTEEQYYAFVNELASADKVPAQDFEEYKFFEACLPIDLMAERGVDTPRFSCMKPIGLEKEEGAERPFAVVQLRKENLLGSAFNLVGFQTRLTFKEQVRVFKMIPGFEEASFIHLGSVHRNSYLNAKKLLNWDMSSKKFPNIYFAGQMTGVEGYTESAASGLYAAYNIARKHEDKSFSPWPVETATGALVNYIMTNDKPTPSNINFGLIPTVALNKEQRRNRKLRKKIKKELASIRARESFDIFLKSEGHIRQDQGVLDC